MMQPHSHLTPSPARPSRIHAATRRLLYVTTYLDLILTIAALAATAIWDQPAAFGGYLLLRATSRLPLSRPFIFTWTRWLHAYLLLFGWLETARCAAPEGAPLLIASFLWGGQLGRVSGRLPNLGLHHHVLPWTVSAVITGPPPPFLPNHCDWAYAGWVAAIVLNRGVRSLLSLDWLVPTARWLVGMGLSAVSTPVRHRDTQHVILAPRVLRPWCNGTIVTLSVAAAVDWVIGGFWTALAFLAVDPIVYAWKHHLAARSHELWLPSTPYQRIRHSIRRRAHQSAALPLGRSRTWLLPGLLLLLGMVNPAAGQGPTSFRDALVHTDGTHSLDVFTAPLLWPIISVASVTLQRLYSASVAASEKTTDRLLAKELQHKRNPYTAGRSPLFDDPTLGAGGPVFAPDYSRDAIPGRIYGNHAEVGPDGVDRLREVLDKYHSTFYYKDAPLGTYRGSSLQFEIPFEDEMTPQYQGPRVFSAKEDELIDKECGKMKDADVLEDAPIDCPHASNPVLAAKKDPNTGDYTDIRFCVDYRAVNKRTRRFNHRTMTPEQLFDRVGQARFISTLDLKSGYHLIPLAEHVRNKTAFWNGQRLVRFKRMPFGLAGSPAFFQLVMDHSLGNLVNKKGKRFTAVYLDDIIIVSDTYEEHLEHIDAVLKRLTECFGPHCVHPDKSIFVSSRVEYLGFILEAGGRLGPHPAKIKAFADLPSPSSLTALRSALSLFSYYRVFIGNFSQLAAPLHELLRANAIPAGVNGFRRAWTTTHEEAFQQLRAALCRPGLAIRNADHDRPFFLHCDWSIHGCGAILTQFDDNNQEYIIACRSRSLNAAEQRYSPYEGEAMTVVWATAIFRSYVYGQQLTVVTDHKPLQYLLGNAELTSKFARWVAILQDLDIRVVHRPGTSMPADHLSRYPTRCSTDATGARRDTDADDVDPIAPVLTTASDPQLNALTAKLRDAHNIYGVSSCFALAIHAHHDPPDASDSDDLMQHGLTDLELRRHRLAPLLPPASAAPPPPRRTAQWLNDVPHPLPLQHRAWVVIELCGGIAAGLHSMTDQGQTIARYIYVDNCDHARQCAADRARMLVERRPHLFRRHAIKHAFDTWPQDIFQINQAHIDELLLQPDESVIVIAGTPCQDWSAAGSQRGDVGTRGSVTPVVASVIASLQQRMPTFYLIENVPPHLKGDPVGTELYERLCTILGNPVMSDAARFDSFAHRLRLYWTNLAPAPWLQSTLDQVRRSPRRYLHHILPAHLKPLKPTGHRPPPYYPCGGADEPRQTLPTIMATMGSYAYRNQGPGMLFNLDTASYVEPPPRVREVAMGHPPDVTAHPTVDECTRIRLIGNSFDMAAINHVLTAAFLLNGRLRTAVTAAVELHPHHSAPHRMLGPLTSSQAAQKYGAFANRELALWGYRPGLSLGLGGGPGLPWPLSHTNRPATATDSLPRPGVGFVPTAQNCGGGETTTVFIPAATDDDTAATDDDTADNSSATTPTVTSSNTTAITTTTEQQLVPATATPRTTSAEPPLPLPNTSVREPSPVPELVRSPLDPWEDDAMLRHLRGEPVTVISADALERRRIILRSNAYALEGETLQRRMMDGSFRLVPPVADRAEIIKRKHDASMHIGEKRMVHLLQQRYSWPHMWKQVHEVLMCCDRCRRVETTLQGANETLHPLPVPLLFSRWHVDYCKLPASKVGFCRVLIAVEALTKFAVLIPTTNKSSGLTAFLFRTHVFGMFGSAAVVVTDRGQEFQAEFDELLNELQIDHRVTSAYRAQANGAAERIVQVVKKTARKLTSDPRARESWERMIPALALAYNASRQSSTGLAPFTCVFAQVPAVPPEAKERFDDALTMETDADNAHDELLATHLLRRMRVVLQCGMMCASNLALAQQRDERRYRLKHSGQWKPQHQPLEVGDFAVIRGQASSAWDVARRKEIYQITGFRDKDQVELRGGDDQRTSTNRSNLAKYPADNVDRTIFPIINLACTVCNAKTSRKTMLICDGCRRGYHAHCLEPPIEEPPENEWFCPPCCGQPAPAIKAPRGRGRPRKTPRSELSPAADHDAQPHRLAPSQQPTPGATTPPAIPPTQHAAHADSAADSDLRPVKVPRLQPPPADDHFTPSQQPTPGAAQPPAMPPTQHATHAASAV